MGESAWNLSKNSIAIQVSREMAVAHGWVEPTDDERAAIAESGRLAEIRRRESWGIYDAAREALAGVSEPVARAILDLHHSDTITSPVCDGCDMEGYESERPGWPCRTVQAVAEHYDIALPDASDLWRRPTEEQP